MLPFGLRVQEKIEKLIDGHMQGLGASKLALSTISSQALWEKSGRLTSVAPELFRFQDRKEVPLLLSPTHEEEITSLVARTIKSYKELPLRLYQITRKYRDEARPRHGLLRGREFIMKDLYTFDPTVDDALATYEEVREAYARFFADLKLPILVAKASSGDMGGDLSHEYHISTSLGEDNVVSCDSCDYTVNDELAETRVPESHPMTEDTAKQHVSVWRGITKDRRAAVNVWYLDPTEGDQSAETPVNIQLIKSIIPELDTSIQDAGPLIDTLELEGKGGNHLADVRLVQALGKCETLDDRLKGLLGAYDDNNKPLNLLKVQSGDTCPKCDHGKLQVEKAIELGHTFHLGTRYSEPLEAKVQLASGGNPVPLQMGCHGIGVSRLIGVVADHLADDKGLNWPRKIAPFEVVVIAKNGAEKDAEELYDQIVQNERGEVDAVLDDRYTARFPWRMKDAELIGYPVVVIMGKSWGDGRQAEVQCRRLGVREFVSADKVPLFVRDLLERV
jgi:prolyl-tRNA synthetase